MGTGHMTVLQFHGPITFCVLQWCHPMLTRTLWRTSCSAWMIALYGDRKRIQARAVSSAEMPKDNGRGHVALRYSHESDHSAEIQMDSGGGNICDP